VDEVFSSPYEQGPNAGGDSCYLLNFFIHGLRYLDVDQAKKSSKVSKGDALVVSHEPVPEDPDALAIRTNDKAKVGYLPRNLAPDTRLIENDPYALQIRVLENRGELCPPNRRIKCQLRACWASGFRPFDLPTFQPIGDATRLFGHNAVLRYVGVPFIAPDRCCQPTGLTCSDHSYRTTLTSILVSLRVGGMLV